MVAGRKGTETGWDWFGKGAIVRKLTGAGAKSLVKSVSGGEQTSEPFRIFPKLLDRHELQLVVDRRDCRAGRSSGERVHGRAKRLRGDGPGETSFQNFPRRL